MIVNVESVRQGAHDWLNRTKQLRESGRITDLWFCNLPANKLYRIQIIRAALSNGQLSLLEAKRLVDSYDDKPGKIIGPVAFKGSLEQARQNLREWLNKTGSTIMYKTSWVKTRNLMTGTVCSHCQSVMFPPVVDVDPNVVYNVPNDDDTEKQNVLRSD